MCLILATIGLPQNPNSFTLFQAKKDKTYLILTNSRDISGTTYHSISLYPHARFLFVEYYYVVSSTGRKQTQMKLKLILGCGPLSMGQSTRIFFFLSLCDQ